MKYKRGITAVSLVVYVILLFAFTTLALNVSRNVNNGMYDDKGLAINLSNYDKVSYYLNKSAIDSTSLVVTDTDLTFSNGDTYSFDTVKQTLSYNGGILAKNITEFSINSGTTNLYEIQIQFTRYSNEISRNIRLYIGE